MTQSQIKEAIENSIDKLCDKFSSHPTLFFTESDLVSYFVCLLKEELGPKVIAIDKEHKQHSIIHQEYPSPFRCDMAHHKFEVMDNEARTPKGGKYQRGHYDVVVLNPDFIGMHSFEVIKGQNYELFKQEVILKLNPSIPVLLKGVEFMYSRDPLKHSRGKDREKGIDEYVAKIIQDTGKLIAGKEIPGFMDQIRMLVFIKGSSQEIQNLISGKLSGRKEIMLCFAN